MSSVTHAWPPSFSPFSRPLNPPGFLLLACGSFIIHLLLFTFCLFFVFYYTHVCFLRTTIVQGFMSKPLKLIVMTLEKVFCLPGMKTKSVY